MTTDTNAISSTGTLSSTLSGSPPPPSAPRRRDANNKLVFGTHGEPDKLCANLFRVKLAVSESAAFFKYSVTIEVLTKVPRDRPIAIKKTELRLVWNALEKARHPHLEGILPVYDGRNACFTARPFTTGRIVIDNLEVGTDRGRRYRITISDPARIELSPLLKFVDEHANPNSKAAIADALAALNVLLIHGMEARNLPADKNTFFIVDPRIVDPQGQGFGRKHREFALARGIVLLRGFFFAIRPNASGGLLLNIDTTSGAFLKPGPLVQLLMAFQSTSDMTSLEARRLTEHARISMGRLLKNVTVDVDLGRNNRPRNNIVIKSRSPLSQNSPRVATFREKDGTLTTVEEYFQKYYQLKLSHPDLPCVEVRKGVLYPPELLRVCNGNRWRKKLHSDQQLAATNFQTIKPQDRRRAIIAIANFAANANLRYMEEFGLQTRPEGAELLEFEGRRLQGPSVEFGLGRIVKPNNGAWRMERGRDEFLSGARLESVVAIVSSPRNAVAMRHFLKALFEALQKLGMSTKQLYSPEIFVRRSPTDDFERTFRSALEAGKNRYGKPCQLVFWLFEKANDFEYHLFKKQGMVHGIATQALQEKNLRKTGDFQMHINMGMKINSKLGGQNFKFVAETLGVQTAPSWFETAKPLIFGADLTHTDGRPSIAAVVCSLDRDGFVYGEEISVQRLVEPSEGAPERFRPKKEEAIVDLEGHVLRLLVRYIDVNKTLPPNDVVFYRDGLSESEFDMCASQEVAAIKRAFEHFRSTEGNDHWKPKLTVIVCLKSHHVRFFGPPAHAQKNIDKKTGNIMAGTVVDKALPHPDYEDWYGAAHAGILGTTRPTRYVPLLDEHLPRLSPDDMQIMTNTLCHALSRCNRAVSLPAPVYHAHLICEKARGWMPPLGAGDGASSVGHSSSGDPASREHDFRTCEHVLEEMTIGRRMLGGLNPNDGTNARSQWWD